MQNLILRAISLYQNISSIFPPCCRFYPSCSQYALEAIKKYGLIRGIFKSLKRILRCHPFSPGGYNPI